MGDMMHQPAKHLQFLFSLDLYGKIPEIVDAPLS